MQGKTLCWQPNLCKSQPGGAGFKAMATSEKSWCLSLCSSAGLPRESPGKDPSSCGDVRACDSHQKQHLLWNGAGWDLEGRLCELLKLGQRGDPSPQQSPRIVGKSQLLSRKLSALLEIWEKLNLKIMVCSGRMVHSGCCWGAPKRIPRINTWSWYIHGPARAWLHLKLASKLDNAIPSSTRYWCSKSRNPKTEGVMESNWG